MMKTRRKSKAEAAAEAGLDGESQPITIVLPDDVDEDTLLDMLPDFNLSAITSEDVITLYRLLLTQSVNLDATERERDELKAELERKDVELDQALQDKESATRDLETSIESTQQELEKVKQQFTQLGTPIFLYIYLPKRLFLPLSSRGENSIADSA